MTDEVRSFAPVGFDTANSVDRPLVYLLDDRDFFASQFSLSHELHDDTLIMKSTLAELEYFATCQNVNLEIQIKLLLSNLVQPSPGMKSCLDSHTAPKNSFDHASFLKIKTPLLRSWFLVTSLVTII